jgi:hypothetical protein
MLIADRIRATREAKKLSQGDLEKRSGLLRPYLSRIDGSTNPTTAKTVLDSEKPPYTEAEVAQVKLPHRPGELAIAASRLGEANTNINYAYGGVEPGTNAPLLVFGVAPVAQAVTILEQATAAAATI